MVNSPETKGSDSNTDNAGASNTSEHTDASASATDDENNEDIIYRNSADRPVFKLSVQLIDTYKYINKVSDIVSAHFKIWFFFIVCDLL